MLDFVFRPLRSALDVGERLISKPLEEPEHDLSVIVDASHLAADSIEHHLEVIEGLATSVEPLNDSVNHRAVLWLSRVRIVTRGVLRHAGRLSHTAASP